MEDKTEQEKISCEKVLGRKEFFKLVLERATLAGSIVLAPAIADKFLVPAAYAAGLSSCTNNDTGGNGGANGMDSTAAADSYTTSGDTVRSNTGSLIETNCTLMSAGDQGTSGTIRSDCTGTICGPEDLA